MQNAKNNFGPIQNIELEIADFTALIGPQASGKSTIAKAIYFFKTLKEEILSFLILPIEQTETNQSAVIHKTDG